MAHPYDVPKAFACDVAGDGTRQVSSIPRNFANLLTYTIRRCPMDAVGEACCYSEVVNIFAAHGKGNESAILQILL
jgi:hypothetical protein